MVIAMKSRWLGFSLRELLKNNVHEKISAHGLKTTQKKIKALQQALMSKNP